MKDIEDFVLPKSAKNDFRGYKFTQYAFLLISFFTVARSLIHILSPDGGAESIATIDLSVEGSSVIIGMFAFWGLSQLLMGILYFIVYFRYQNLIPLMYIFLIIEYLSRILIGMIKPFETMGTAPGAIGNFILVPLVFVMLIFSIKEPKN